MRPASLRLASSSSTFSCSSYAPFAARNAPSDAVVDRGDVGRAQADGGAELVVRVGVARIGGDARARERQRVFERVVERGHGVRRRRGSGRARAADAAEIVVDGHVAAAERDAQPQRARQAAIGRRRPADRRRRPAGRCRRRGRDRGCRFRPRRAREAPPIRGWPGRRAPQISARQSQGRVGGAMRVTPLTEENCSPTPLRLRELVPSAYNCPLGFPPGRTASKEGVRRWIRWQPARRTGTNTRMRTGTTTLTRSWGSGASTCSRWTTRSSGFSTPSPASCSCSLASA